MKKIIAIGGEPATGKSMLVDAAFSALGRDQFTVFTYGLLKGHISRERKLIILGVYKEGVVRGTDSLSGSVLEDAKNFLQNNSFEEFTLVFEGERLFSVPFLQVCNETTTNLQTIVLRASKEILKERRSMRIEDKKGSMWKNQSRIGKVYSAARVFGARFLTNETMVDYEDNLKRLMKYIA